MKDKYEAGRDASLKTFMKRVITRRILNILKEKERHKRKAFYTSLSLDELLDDVDSAYIEKFLKINDEGCRSLIKEEMPLVLSKALEKLSLRQKELCRLFSEEGLNMKQASERMSVPRSTLQEEIKRIREIFREEGLEDYLV